MSDVVIRVDGLGKKYLIGHQAERERYVTLREVLARTVKGFVRSARDVLHGQQLIVGDEVEEFWALKDVNFEIKRGDVVGIIGRNGAGKSTLLKILSRITEPSAGRVEIKGRVASLLEVGTGFHPELSGRENIYLNGAILGMSRAEIKRKFDEIVAFAEVEKFLDTPVKRYSSGMYVRLAFAVAAHLEPEILVVDEVLAVGDAEFQKKCLGKMGEAAGHGRTVLFVSHNMSAVRVLTRTCMHLSDGRIAIIGPTNDAVTTYQKVSSTQICVPRAANSAISIDSILVNDSTNSTQPRPDNGQLNIELKGRIGSPQRVSVEMALRTIDGNSIGSFFPDHFRTVNLLREKGKFRILASLQIPPCLTGELALSLYLTEPFVRGICEVDPLVTLQTISPAIASPGPDLTISSGQGPTILSGDYLWEPLM